MRLRFPRLPQRAVKLLRLLLLASLLAFSVGLLIRYGYEQHIRHETETQRYSSLSRTGNTLNPNTATKLCAKSALQPYHPGRNYRKIYDLFVLDHELDWLEIRLHTLSAYVDYFVIVETATTAAGHKKPLYLRENWARFEQWHHQVIPHVFEQDPTDHRRPGLEDRMRDALFDQIFPTLPSTPRAANPGDVLLVSDVSELPKPSSLVTLRNCDIPRRVTLENQHYHYSFQWRQKNPVQWSYPQVTIYGGLGHGTIYPTDLRNDRGGHGWLWFLLGGMQRRYEKMALPDAGWYCEHCYGTIAEVRGAMGRFEEELNTAKNRRADSIVVRVRKGQDLFGREGQVTDRVERNQDVPGYILQHAARFKHLLDRDGHTAGFEDYVEAKRED
ncbi:hypothetical protein MBLNU230_g1764t1 [Neophaeotheca triangularis]